MKAFKITYPSIPPLPAFSYQLKENPKSLWRNEKWFTEENRNEITQSLLERSKEQKFDLPKEVLEDIIDTLMFGEHITVDGMLPSSEYIAWSPLVYLQYDSEIYFFHQGETHRAFVWLDIALTKCVEERRKQLERQEEEHREDKIFQKISNHPNFLFALKKEHEDFPITKIPPREFFAVQRSFTAKNDESFIEDIVNNTHCYI